MSSSHSILIVDDSASMRNIMKKFLEASGYTQIIEAVDGKDAIDMLSINKINLIISNLYMPKVNGLDLLKATLNHSVFKSIPFVVLTSEAEDETFKKAMQMGATDFIITPFSQEELAVKIKSVIK